MTQDLAIAYWPLSQHFPSLPSKPELTCPIPGNPRRPGCRAALPCFLCWVSELDQQGHVGVSVINSLYSLLANCPLTLLLLAILWFLTFHHICPEQFVLRLLIYKQVFPDGLGEMQPKLCLYKAITVKPHMTVLHFGQCVDGSCT